MLGLPCNRTSPLEPMQKFPNTWYHGSPYCCLSSFSEFAGNIIFLTDSKHIAMQYTKKLLDTGLGSSKKPSKINLEEKPVLYTVSLSFGEDRVFNINNPEHKALFATYNKFILHQDPEETKHDLESAQKAKGSSFYGYFPNFGKARLLLDFVKNKGFKACLISEGSQGVSLIVSDPANNVKLVKTELIGAKLASTISGLRRLAAACPLCGNTQAENLKFHTKCPNLSCKNYDVEFSLRVKTLNEAFDPA